MSQRAALNRAARGASATNESGTASPSDHGQSGEGRSLSVPERAPIRAGQAPRRLAGRPAAPSPARGGRSGLIQQLRKLKDVGDLLARPGPVPVQRHRQRQLVEPRRLPPTECPDAQKRQTRPARLRTSKTTRTGTLNRNHQSRKTRIDAGASEHDGRVRRQLEQELEPQPARAAARALPEARAALPATYRRSVIRGGRHDCVPARSGLEPDAIPIETSFLVARLLTYVTPSGISSSAPIPASGRSRSSCRKAGRPTSSSRVSRVRVTSRIGIAASS